MNKPAVYTTLESSRIARTVEEWELLLGGVPIGLPHSVHVPSDHEPDKVYTIDVRMQEIADVSGKHSRTNEQMIAVRKLHEKLPFTHWCNNPFDSSQGLTFRCRFYHMFYAGKHLYVAQIYPNGRVRYAAVPTTGPYHWEELK